MERAQDNVQTIDEYIAQFPPDVQAVLNTVRATIRAEAPGAVEAIKYMMPTFILHGKNLVHFGAFTHHVGFYPTPSGIQEFEAELSRYKRAKGSVQFPLSEPMPLDLIRRIVAYRVQESEAAQARKKQAR